MIQEHTSESRSEIPSEESQTLRFSKAVCIREYRGKNPEGRPNFYITIPRDVAQFMGLKSGELLEVVMRRLTKIGS